MKVLQEFKSFALKGNVMDLAVGVIIGGAFGKIVSSLVNDIVMPPIGLLLSGIDFKNLAWVWRYNEDGTPAAALRYGQFIQNCIEFLVIAMCVFALVQLLNRLHRKKEKQEEAKPPEPSEEVLLLRDIRNSLKKRS